MDVTISLVDLVSEGLRAAVEEWKKHRSKTLHFGDLVCLRSADGSLLRTDDALDLIGGERKVNDGSLFRIVDPGRAHFTGRGKRLHSGSMIGLRQMGCGNFVGANFDLGGVLTCYAAEVREWETFRVGPARSRLGSFAGLRYGRVVDLQVHSKYHMTERWWWLRYYRESDQRVRADNDARVDAWERFVLVDPERPF